MSTFTTKAGDYHRRIQLDLSDISTTGASGVTFRLQARGGGTLTSWAGVIDSASRVSAAFPAGSIDTAGVYLLEAALTYVDGTETVPTSGYVTVVVEATLA